MLVTNAFLAHMLLEHVIERTEVDMDGLLIEDVSGEFIDILRRRPARDILKLASRPENLGIVVTFDEKKIIDGLHNLEMKLHDEKLLEEFLQKGASERIIKRFFRVSSDDLREKRGKFFCTRQKKILNDKMPHEKLRNAIHQQWYDMQESDIRQKILALQNMFPEWSISALCGVLSEFENPQMESDRSDKVMKWLDSEIQTQS